MQSPFLVRNPKRIQVSFCAWIRSEHGWASRVAKMQLQGHTVAGAVVCAARGRGPSSRGECRGPGPAPPLLPPPPRPRAAPLPSPAASPEFSAGRTESVRTDKEEQFLSLGTISIPQICLNRYAPTNLPVVKIHINEHQQSAILM